MLCSLSLFVLPLLLSLPSVPSVLTLSTTTTNLISHATKQTLSDQIHYSNDNMQLPPSEAETLFKIMESMSSDQTWRTSCPNPCQPDSSWPGIECKVGNDDRFHVSRLDFGTLPYPTCKKTASFPSLIFALPFLQSVFFFNCFTLTKATLSLPEDLVFINSSLQQLSLRSNPALSGIIPPQISKLKSLKILTLSQNHLSGKIPVEIFGLSSLVHLDLSYNMLSGTIPNQVGNLESLVGLDLSYNILTGSIPSTIGQLGQLQKLDLSSNLLTGGIPDGIGELSLLVFMALSNNQLSKQFPEGMEKLQNLQYFIMDDNPMSIPLPLELGKLVKLQELRLSDSGYSGTIPESFCQLKNLSTLSLQNNRLTGEIPVGFGDLSHIYHLNLSRNLLGGIVPFNSNFLSRLGRNLDLSRNPGLCLSSSEAYSVKIGVNICGRNKKGSISQPLMSSRVPSDQLSKSFFLLSAFGALVLHQILFM
ncbi:LRR domain containing protein [Parasponia andersonii]|uniref:LRR domain containing protein n=1 Tax=Parasponia andersonii TaxID=3476 RepID=A0A2P5D7W9_PARAD|nr:LRR domain containing protein [Parasponia andersonii]